MANTYTLIEAKTIGTAVASVTFTSIPQTYTDLLLRVSARNSAGSTGIQIEFNASATGYTNRRLFGDGSGVTSDAPGLNYISNTMIDDSGYTASTFGNGDIYIPNYTSSNYKSVSIDGVTENNATGALSMFTAGLWSNTAAITAVKLTAESAGNFVINSTFYLYGISNS